MAGRRKEVYRGLQHSHSQGALCCELQNRRSSSSRHLKVRTVKHRTLRKICMNTIKTFQMPRQEDSLRFSSALLLHTPILALAGPSASEIEVTPTCLLYCVSPLSPGLTPVTPPRATCCDLASCQTWDSSSAEPRTGLFSGHTDLKWLSE